MFYETRVYGMKVYGFIGDKRGKSGSVEQILRLLNGRFPQALVNALVTGKADGLAGNDARNANFVFRMILRMFLDAWIDTGKTEGGENASERTFWRNVLQDYVERNPPMVELSEQGPYLVMFPRAWDKQKKLSAFAADGANTMLSQLKEVPAEEVRSLRRIMPFIWDTAIALVLQLLDSPERTRLFRCDGCGAYSMRTRAPKKNTPIYHGTWCENCKGKGSAMRTKGSRGTRTERMIGWAADAMEQWRPENRFGKEIDWIVKKVNACLKAAGRDPIKSNWVARHLQEIKTEVERRKHAKG